MPQRWLAVAFICIVFTASCSEDDFAKAKLEGTWMVQSHDALPDTPESFDLTRAQISFDNGRWSGSDGCNDVGGTYKLSGDHFESYTNGNAAVGCVGGSVDYELLLAKTSSIKFEGDDHLNLISADGEVLLPLVPAP